MRKYIYLMLLSGMMACQEDDLVQYTQDKDALQFSRSYERSKSFNFATAYENRNGSAHYWGDSLAETKMKVVLQLQGFPTPDERPYKLKTVFLEGQDTSKVAEVRFEPYYSLAPNQLLDTIEFTVLRPKARGNYTIGIAVVTDGDDAFFEKGAEECAVYELKIADRYDEPADWREREEWLGEFDPEKYAFMVTIKHMPFNRDNYYMWNRTERFNAELQTALEEFNASRPEEERKQFTFPNMPKWVWWDDQTKWLGEFSIEKYNFMLEMLNKYGATKEEEFQSNSKLEWWNLVFREVLAEEAREGIEFPRNTEPSKWWRDSIIGEWSLEKQEFVVEELFPKSNFQIGETTWDYAAPVLRRCVDRYNLKNPEPLNYIFVDKGKPEWWDTFEYLFGPYSPIKRDIVVETVLNYQIDKDGKYNIDPLKNEDTGTLANLQPTIKTQIKEYNTAHPGQEITDLPSPVWWNKNLLGEYSEEKEEYMDYVIDEFDGKKWMGSWIGQLQEHWATVFRCCVGWYNQETGKTLVNDFPVTDGKWSWWDENVWGEYSEVKKTFVLWVLFREIPYFNENWIYYRDEKFVKDLLKNALTKYNENNDPDLPFNFD